MEDKKNYKEVSYLKQDEYNFDINLIISYTGICFIIYTLKSKKETPIDILLNFNYYLPKMDELEEHIYIAFIKNKNKSSNIISINKELPLDTINNLQKENEIILNDVILGKEKDHINIKNIDKRLYDRPIVFSYAVYHNEEGKVIEPRGKLGSNFDFTHRFSRGLSAIMDRNYSTSLEKEGINEIFFDEDSSVRLQPDYVCFLINGWNEYNRTGLSSKIENVYFELFLLVITQFYTLNYFSYNHIQARTKKNTKAIHRFVTLIRKYKIELLFDMVSLNTNLKRYYEGLWETYEIRNQIENVEKNLTVDENKIERNNESAMNRFLLILTVIGVPLGAITEMIDNLISEWDDGVTVKSIFNFDSIGWFIIFTVILIDIIFIIYLLIKRNKIDIYTSTKAIYKN
ncbi:MAG: hypothetical protein ACOCV8_05750, partial [Spirochaetota bacterium]